HLAADGAAMGALRLVGRQQPGLGLDLMQILGDRQGIADLEPVVHQARHQERRRQQQQLGPRRRVVGADMLLLEIEIRHFAQQPTAQRPRAVVLAGDGESGLRHSARSFFKAGENSMPYQDMLLPRSMPRAARKAKFRAPFLACAGCSYSCRSATKNALAFHLGVGSRFAVARRPTAPVDRGMLYVAYQLHSDIMVPVRTWAGMAANSGGAPLLADHPAMRNLTAVYELIARAGLTHTRPPFGIDRVTVGNREVEVREEAAHVTPFGTLLHFKKDIATAQPRVLMVAPLSGHFSTLLRATVRTMLPEHDVYVTDWHNARDVPLTAGRFGFDEYIDHLIKFLDVMGPGTHVLAVCQPCVAVLAAVAVMAQAGNKAQPRSMTLMAGPIDTRVNPTTVDALANKR